MNQQWPTPVTRSSKTLHSLHNLRRVVRYPNRLGAGATAQRRHRTLVETAILATLFHLFFPVVEGTGRAASIY